MRRTILLFTSGIKVLLLGGLPDEASVNVETLELTESPSSCPDFATFKTEMFGHVAAYFQGKLIVCGGLFESACQRYDTSRRRWQKIGRMPSEREDAVSVLVSPDQWWIAGGYPSRKTSTIFDGSRFSPGPDLPYPADAACAVLLTKTHIFLAGGRDGDNNYRSDAYLLEWETKTWVELPPMTTARAMHGCNLAGGGQIVVVGGYNGNGYLGSSEIYSPTTNAWSRGPGLPEGIGTLHNIGSATVQLPFENTFAIFGGEAKGQPSDMIVEYDPIEGEWVILEERLKLARLNHVAIRVPHSFNC